MSADVGNGQVREIEEMLSAFIPTQRPVEPVTPETLAAAHRISRQWISSEVGTLHAGTPAHRRAICAMFGETFNPYRPSVIIWPVLDAEQLQRLKSLPIWDIAVQTEGRAQLHFAAYANSLADADMRATILLNAWEENRHKQVLSKLVEAYGIKLLEEPSYKPPRDVEWAFLVTGYSECIDSFFAFGLFDLARRSGFFPMELVETFEPVIQEECRHILFFANWLAWHRANLPWWRRLFFELRVAAVWIHIGWLRVRLAWTMSPAGKTEIPDPNFTLRGAKSVTPIDLGFRDLVALCLTENDRRFAGYDTRLVRPTAIPSLFRFMLGISKKVDAIEAIIASGEAAVANCEAAGFCHTPPTSPCRRQFYMSASLLPGELTLVTGGAGFLGSAVVRALIARGARVRVLVRPTSPRDNLLGLDCEVVVGDLTDKESLKGALKDVRYLFHVAADYRLWARDPSVIMRANVEGTLNLKREALSVGVERIVYTSSVAALRVAGATLPVDETAALAPDEAIGAYKRSKTMAERAVEEMILRDGLPAIIVNPTTPIGPRDIRPTPTGRILLDAARGRIPAFVDTGLNFAHVDDIAAGHLLAFDHGRIGERYILGGENLSLQDLLGTVARATGRRMPRIKLPRGPLFPLAVAAQAFAHLTGREPLLTVDGLRMSKHRMFFTSAKAERELGYRSRPYQEGVADALAWFRHAGYLT